MLSGTKIFTSDAVWSKILSELGATLVSDAIFADVNLDAINMAEPVTVAQLKSAVVAAQNDTDVLVSIFGRVPNLSQIQSQIIIKLRQSGGMTADELKIALGYAPSAKTHTVDTAIYGLRKIYGHDFIEIQGGKYKIGKL